MTIKEDVERFLADRNFVSPWTNMDNTRNNLFTGNASVISVKKGDFLFRQGETNHNIYIVRTGRMRISFVDNVGDEICVYIAETGGMLGEAAAVDQLPSCLSACAIVDCTLYQINIADFIRIIRLHPDVSLEAMCNITAKLRRLCCAVEYTTKSSQARVSSSLLALCARYGQELPEGGARIAIRFTHEELANLNNLNRVTVTKLLRALMRAGAISSDNGCLTIHDVQALKDMMD